MTDVKRVNYTGAYRVGAGAVRLKVSIGDGQFGSTLVQLGDESFPHARDFDQELGKGAQLVGKRLRIFSIATDTNKQTNRTSVTYRLVGGPMPLEHELSFTVTEERASVDYEADIMLVGGA